MKCHSSVSAMVAGMPKAGQRSLRVCVAAAALLASATTATAESLLRCQPKDAVALEEDGTLQRNFAADREMEDVWIVDITTGAIRISNGQNSIGPVHYTVIQRGDSRNDTVLARLGLRTTNLDKLDVADAVTDFIRIRQWSFEAERPAVRFIRYHLSLVVSGTCEPIS